MKRHVLLNLGLAFGLLSAMVLVPVGQTAQAQAKKSKELVAPTVFQAAGPTADSIQGTVDAFRAALGDPNNGNNPGPLNKAVVVRSTGTVVAVWTPLQPR